MLRGAKGANQCHRRASHILFPRFALRTTPDTLHDMFQQTANSFKSISQP